MDRKDKGIEMFDYDVVCVNLNTGEESKVFTVQAPTKGHLAIVAAAKLIYPDMQVDRYHRQ